MCTVECDPVFAASRNTHKRTEFEVTKLARTWEETPGNLNFNLSLIEFRGVFNLGVLGLGLLVHGI